MCINRLNLYKYRFKNCENQQKGLIINLNKFFCLTSVNMCDIIIHRVFYSKVGEVTMCPASEDNIEKYDFHSPKKFTKEELHILMDLHEVFARSLSTYFTGVLRTFCAIEVLDIEEQRFYDFTNALPEKALIGLVEIAPKETRYEELTTIINVSNDIGFFIVERLLGGAEELNNLAKREFTDVELSILTNIFDKMATILQDTWSSYLDNDVSLSGIETNSALIQSIPPKEVVVLVMFNVMIGNISENMEICIPANALGDLIGEFTNKYMRRKHRKLDDETKATLVENVVDSEIDVKAIFTNTVMPVHQAMNLRVDDVINFYIPTDSDVHIEINNSPWFTGKIGIVRANKAVKLKELILENAEIDEEEFYDGRTLE